MILCVYQMDGLDSFIMHVEATMDLILQIILLTMTFIIGVLTTFLMTILLEIIFLKFSIDTHLCLCYNMHIK